MECAARSGRPYHFLPFLALTAAAEKTPTWQWRKKKKAWERQSKSAFDRMWSSKRKSMEPKGEPVLTSIAFRRREKGGKGGLRESTRQILIVKAVKRGRKAKQRKTGGGD